MVTVNMASDEDLEDLPVAWVSQWEHIKYAVWQLEVGEQGVTHWQLYVNFGRSVRLGFVKSLRGLERCHAKPRVKSKLACVEYCSKPERLDGPYWYPSEGAVRRHASIAQGQRHDIEGLAAGVKAGMTDAEIADVMPVMIIKYSKGIDALRLASTPSQRLGNEIDSVVYLGPTGTGKSRRLRLGCPEGPAWYWVSPGKWFDNYAGQPGLVFDEFRDFWIPYYMLLRLLDVGPYMVERKGGHLHMRAFRFRFSTNVHPKAWYRGRQGKVPWPQDPLRRRLGAPVLMLDKYEGLPEFEDPAEEWWESQPEALEPEVRALFGQRLG